MFSHYAFVDEAGNHGFEFDKEKVSKYFVVTAVIVETKHLQNIQQHLQDLRAKYFESRDIMLSRLMKHKRQTIIAELLKMEFGIYAVVVHKEKLRKDGGFGVYRSFFKYVNGLLYNYLFDVHTHIQVFADYYGDSTFMKEFATYIDNRHQPDLFNTSFFQFDKRSENTLIQLADVISDVIFHTFESDQKEYNNILRQLSHKIIRIETWPTTDWNRLMNHLDEIDRQFDQVIAKQSIQGAKRFIYDHQQSEVQVIKDRVNFLKFLLTHLSIGKNDYLYSQEIIKNMQTFSPETMSRDDLMGEIVGPLRDEGILIASTSNGYKLPTSSKDLIDYVNFSSSMIIPILRRLDKSRNRILMATNNELDILEGEKFKELKAFFDVKYERQ